MDFAITEEEGWTVSSLLQVLKDNYMFIIYVYALIKIWQKSTETERVICNLKV